MLNVCYGILIQYNQSKVDFSMKQTLVYQSQPDKNQGCCSGLIQFIKIACLVLGTYGLMVAMFALCLAIQNNGQTNIANSYQVGGGILLALFAATVLLFGFAWCWGAPKREQLRKFIVSQQLARIRQVEQASQRQDLQQQRQMIEERRRQLKG